jgi:hypothetical protein
VLIPKYGGKISLLRRYIDDIFCVVLIGGDDGMSKVEWQQFKTDLNDFGILTWDTDEPASSVSFLDLTIEIENGLFITTTYRKPMNLYQYIPPHSAHPPGMIKGMIYGMLRTYYRQNSRREDYWKNAMQFYKLLKNRGWLRATIESIFVSAHEKIISQPRSNKKHQQTTNHQDEDEELLILHLEYHPNDIPRKQLRQIYNEHLGHIVERSKFDGGLSIDRSIIAYHRPPNLRDLLQSAKLHETKGGEVSTYFGG